MSGEVGDARKRLAESVTAESAPPEVRLTEAELAFLLDDAAGCTPHECGLCSLCRGDVVHAVERILADRLSTPPEVRLTDAERKVLDDWWWSSLEADQGHYSDTLHPVVERILADRLSTPAPTADLSERVAALCDEWESAQAYNRQHIGSLLRDTPGPADFRALLTPADAPRDELALADKVRALADEATGDRDSALKNRYDTPAHHARWNTAENFRALLDDSAGGKR